MSKKRTLGIAFTYVGAVVGAGFSSGQEIWRFFARHQIWGMPGIFLTGIFFTFLAPRIFLIGKRLGVKCYHNFFYNYLRFPLSLLFDLIYSSFLLGSVAVMIAGGGIVFKEFLGLPYIMGIVITIFFILITLFLEVEGIYIVNSFMIPILVIATLITVSYFVSNNSILLITKLVNLTNSGRNWFLDGVLYISYNTVMVVAVMTGIVYQEDEKNIIIGGFTGGLIIFILAAFLFTGLITAYCKTPDDEIPIIHLASRGGKILYFTYVVSLYFAMLSTAIANFFAFNKRFSAMLKINYNVSLVITTLLLMPLVKKGFSKLIKYLYPVYGFLGFFIVLFFLYLVYNESKNK